MDHDDASLRQYVDLDGRAAYEDGRDAGSSTLPTGYEAPEHSKSAPGFVAESTQQQPNDQQLFATLGEPHLGPRRQEVELPVQVQNQGTQDEHRLESATVGVDEPLSMLLNAIATQPPLPPNTSVPDVASYHYGQQSEAGPSHANHSIQGLLEASRMIGTNSTASPADGSSSSHHEHVPHQHSHEAATQGAYFSEDARDMRAGDHQQEEDDQVYREFVHGDYEHERPIAPHLEHARSSGVVDGYAGDLALAAAGPESYDAEGVHVGAHVSRSVASSSTVKEPRRKIAKAADAVSRARKRKIRPSEGPANGMGRRGNDYAVKAQKARQGSRDSDDEESAGKVPRISRMFAATMGPNGSRIPEQQMSFSTISVLCGWVAQKSYGKEKRFLCPPPVVRMNGGVSDTVETTVLQIVNHDIGPEIPLISNSQGVRFNIEGKEEDARDYLRDGMYFPGLFASRTGKARSLKLKLSVFQPGGTDARDSRRKVPTSEPAANLSHSYPDTQEELHGIEGHGEQAASSMFDEFDRNGALNMLDPAVMERRAPADIAGNDNDGVKDDAADPLADSADDEAPAHSNAMVQEMSATTVRPWAVFESTPMTILSKPSKRTSKIRGTPSSALQVGDPVALWSRINSQSIRTKYMFSQRGALLGKPSDWSAFVIDVVKRGQPPEGWEHPTEASDDPNDLTYGSIVTLRDIHTQFRTEPLLLCKVENGRCRLSDWGPVSQLQKVAFAKTVPGQGRWYLRAPGQDREKIDEATGEPAKRIRKRIRGKKDMVNRDVKKRIAPALDREDTLQDGPVVKFHKPKVQIELIDGEERQSDFMDDFISWSLSGVTEHNYTFFEGRHEVGDFSTVFKSPLTPMPTLLEIPLYNPQDNSVTMTVTDYFYDDDDPTFRGKPLLLYLGAIGPLRLRTYKSTAPVIQEPTEGDAGTVSLNSYPAMPLDDTDDLPPEARPYSSIPSSEPHTILVIQLPSPHDMWEATRIERERHVHAEHMKALQQEESRDGHADIIDDSYCEPTIEELHADADLFPQRPAKENKPKEEESGHEEKDGHPEQIEAEVHPATPPAPPPPSHLAPDSSEHDMERLYVNHDMDSHDTQQLQHDQDPQRFLDEAYANMEAFSNQQGQSGAFDPVLQDFQPDVSEDVHELFAQAALQAAAAAASGEDHLMGSESMLSGPTSEHATAAAELSQMINEADQTTGPAQGPAPAADRLAKPKTKRSRKSKGDGPPTPKVRKPRAPRKPRVPPPKPTIVANPLAELEAPAVRLTKRPFGGSSFPQTHGPKESALGHSSLPLLFLRQSDGTGYHTGKNVVIERLYPDTENETWDIRVV